jgi:3-phenylpropionate/cinnamic acid dioxygenase small subunit
MIYTTYLINKIKGEIDDLEMELNYYHNSDTISPEYKTSKIIENLEKISMKKNILELYLNYILESKQNENA